MKIVIEIILLVPLILVIFILLSAEICIFHPIFFSPFIGLISCQPDMSKKF